jgi:protein-S-isoprenylcysteine O-methyltransferase Ste14
VTGLLIDIYGITSIAGGIASMRMQRGTGRSRAVALATNALGLVVLTFAFVAFPATKWEGAIEGAGIVLAIVGLTGFAATRRQGARIVITTKEN